MRSDFEPRRIKEAAEVLGRQLEAAIQHAVYLKASQTGSKRSTEEMGWWMKLSKRLRSLFS